MTELMEERVDSVDGVDIGGGMHAFGTRETIYTMRNLYIVLQWRS